MQVAIELPEDIGQELQARWKDLPRHALEAMALEGYRSGELTEWQVQRMLGYENRLEVHRFLREHGAHLEYTREELERELETCQHLSEISKRESRAR